MVWFWLALTIALIVVEISTVQLVCIWFAVGAAVTAIVKAIFGSLALPWQLLIFICVSLILLISTRKLVKRLLKNKKEENAINLDRNIGKEARVVEEIDNVNELGAVKLGGLVWSARSIDNSKIEVGEIVIFKEIKGNKAIVERIKKGE